jgi:hypothetical protein
MPHCERCRLMTDHSTSEHFHASAAKAAAKQQADQHRESMAELKRQTDRENESLAEERRHRRAVEAKIAADEDRAAREEERRGTQDAESRYLHTIDEALRRTRDAVKEDPPLHYLFVLQLRRRMEGFEVTNLAPEERHIPGEVIERIEKRLRSVRKRIPETAEELDEWVDAVRTGHGVDERVRTATVALAKYREENSIPSQVTPQSTVEARHAMAGIHERLARWQATAPPSPPTGILTLALAWKLNSRWFPSASTLDAIASTGGRAYAAATKRWGPQGNWGAVGSPTGKAMLQSTVLILLMAAGAWYFAAGPDLPLAVVVVAVFTGGFGIVRLVQEGLARQTVTDAVHHYETWAKEIGKLDGDLASVKDLTEALADAEEFRTRAAELRRWESKYPACQEAVLEAAVGRDDDDGDEDGDDEL